MKRCGLSFASRSIVPVALSMAILQSPIGSTSSVFGSCATFAPHVALPAAGAVSGIAVADFNRDGLVDLAVTNFTSGGGNPNNVAILLGDGRGLFGAPTRFAVGRGATRIVASDLDADANVDVAVLNSNDATISVLLGDGQGGFAPQTAFFTGGGTVGLALGDFNGDGTNDLVVTDIFTDRITVLFGAGDGSFSAPNPFPVGSGPLLVAVGDVNGDRTLDVAVDNILDETVSILPGIGDGTFGPQVVVPLPGGSLPQSLALSDLNGDQLIDLVVVNGSDDTVLVFLGHGDGSFDTPAAFGVGGQPVFVVVEDLDNDGRPDLAVGNVEDATVSVLLGRGDGTFDSQPSFAVGGSPLPVAAGDFNSDGALDLVAGNIADQTVSVLINTVRDATPPEISSIVANPSRLDAPDHELVPVSIIAVADDRCDAAPSCKIVSVTSSDRGPGFRSRIGRPDVVISDPGPETSPARLGVMLRAGRTGPGSRRIYTINVSCADAAGNVSSGQTTVTVEDHRGKPPRTVRSTSQRF